MIDFFFPLFLILNLHVSDTGITPEYSKSRCYYGIHYDDPKTFVANYIERDKLTGFYLSAPIVFKISQDSDTLFIFSANKVHTAVRNNCSGEYVTPPNLFYQIDRKNRNVQLKQDFLKIKFLKKSMI